MLTPTWARYGAPLCASVRPAGIQMPDYEARDSGFEARLPLHLASLDVAGDGHDLFEGRARD